MFPYNQHAKKDKIMRVSKTFRIFASKLERIRIMTTMTVQIPNNQVGWFEQMIQAMGWVFKKEEAPVKTGNSRVFEAEVDELLSMFNTDQISQEEIDRECELVKEELYNAR